MLCEFLTRFIFLLSGESLPQCYNTQTTDDQTDRPQATEGNDGDTEHMSKPSSSLSTNQKILIIHAMYAANLLQQIIS